MKLLASSFYLWTRENRQIVVGMFFLTTLAGFLPVLACALNSTISQIKPIAKRTGRISYKKTENKNTFAHNMLQLPAKSHFLETKMRKRTVVSEKRFLEIFSEIQRKQNIQLS